MEKALKLKRMVKAAMVYPMLILGVSVVVIVVMMTFVIPIFEKMFASFAGAKLPAPTQMVIDISHGFKNNFFLIALVAGALFFGLKSAAKTKKGRYTIDATLIKLPLFGDLIKKVAVARFARTLGTMISSGVPILDAMDIVSRASGNMVIEEAIVYAKNGATVGIGAGFLAFVLIKVVRGEAETRKQVWWYTLALVGVTLLMPLLAPSTVLVPKLLLLILIIMKV